MKLVRNGEGKTKKREKVKKSVGGKVGLGKNFTFFQKSPFWAFIGFLDTFAKKWFFDFLASF
jgi:hypothetical protein